MEVATMLSEVDRRIAETKKDMYEFKRDVIGELRSSMTHETKIDCFRVSTQNAQPRLCVCQKRCIRSASMAASTH